MNEQKQIEEMAKEKCKHFDKEVCSKLDCKKDCKYYGKANCCRCIHKDICELRSFSYCEEEVREKGCDDFRQEIPENAVVLTREEYDYLINDCKRWENLAVEKVDEIITTRKETAEKFAERLKSKRKYLTTKSYNTVEVVFVKDIDEICKEIAEGEKWKLYLKKNFQGMEMIALLKKHFL